MKKIILIIIIVFIFLTAFSGCMGTDSRLTEDTTENTISPQQEKTAPSEPIIIKDAKIPNEVLIMHSAVPVNDNTALLIHYTLDSSKTNPSDYEKGWKITVTAFAYNTQDMPGFNPSGSQDVRNSNVPYQSRNIHVYSKNEYSDKIEISTSPSGQKIDPQKPYNYGIVFAIQ